jgi:hypothetical protein
MVMSMTFKGITIQVEWLYADNIQRHNHTNWMVMPIIFKGVTFQVEYADIIIYTRSGYEVFCNLIGSLQTGY